MLKVRGIYEQRSNTTKDTWGKDRHTPEMDGENANVRSEMKQRTTKKMNPLPFVHQSLRQKGGLAPISEAPAHHQLQHWGELALLLIKAAQKS